MTPQQEAAHAFCLSSGVRKRHTEYTTGGRSVSRRRPEAAKTAMKRKR